MHAILGLSMIFYMFWGPVALLIFNFFFIKYNSFGLSMMGLAALTFCINMILFTPTTTQGDFFNGTPIPWYMQYVLAGRYEFAYFGLYVVLGLSLGSIALFLWLTKIF
jgi:phosphatidylserine synthase